MASPDASPEEKKDLTSLDKEDIFIIDTTKLARLFFDVEPRVERNRTRANFTVKGVGPSRTVKEEAGPAADDAHLAAAEYVGRRLRELAAANDDTFTRAFERYVEGTAQTIWDINYETFQRIMTDVIASQQDHLMSHLNRIVLIFAGGLHISEALREAGNDQFQNRYLDTYARYVSRFIVDQGLMPWVEQQGGWEQIGNSSSANGTAV